MISLDETYEILKTYIAGNQGNTVLLLGPELSVNAEGISYRSFFKKLAADSKYLEASKDPKSPEPTIAYGTRYFESENLFSFNDIAEHKKVRMKVANFYSKAGDPVLLEMISRIKFPLVINVCPDRALNAIYKGKGIPIAEGYFVTNPIKDEIIKPTRETPVVYNIFGSVQNAQSLILKHVELYNLMESLLPKLSLPLQIEDYLNSADSFIFLGFKFDSWYYQLICHKLKVKIGESAKINLGAPNFEQGVTSSVVMKDHFDIFFTDQNPTQVIQRLLADCEGTDALRPKSPNGVYSTFISYAWKDADSTPQSIGAKREGIVNLIQNEINSDPEKRYQVFRDKDDLRYGDSIDSFMTRIGTGKTVIRVISDKYLRSSYCMTEALRIDKYEDSDKRVFTVLVDDLVKDAEDEYKKFWQAKCFSVVESKETLDRGDYEDFIGIYRFINPFFKKLNGTVHLRLKPSDIVVDENGNVTIAAERGDEFKKFIRDIIQKMKDE